MKGDMLRIVNSLCPNVPMSLPPVIKFCRLMRRRIKVADPRIFLIYARKWSMNIIMNNIQQADE